MGPRLPHGGTQRLRTHGTSLAEVAAALDMTPREFAALHARR